MTVGTEGEPDDPYGYLYRPGPGDAQGGQAAPAGFGSSPYVQVGQTRYGQPQPYQPPAPDTQATQPVPGVSPQAAPGGTPPPGQVPSPRRDGGHGGGSRGSRGGRGPVIGAIVAIVVVIAVIAAVIALNGDDDDKTGADKSPQPSVTTTAQSSAPPTSAAPSASGPGKFGEQEAEDGQLAGSAALANNSTGYSGNGFVGGLTAPGASITISVDAPKKGTYSLFVVYANPDPVSQSGSANRPKKTLTVKANGEAKYGQINLYGTGGADKWWETYRTIELAQGANTVTLSCEPGDSCNVTVDKLYVGDKK